MSITFRIGESGRAGSASRTVNSVGAAGVITMSSANSFAVGDTAELTGMRVPENDGVGYTVTAVSGSNVTLRPFPTRGGTLSSPGSTNLTFTNNASPTEDTLFRATGSWITDGFDVGHYFAVTGSGSNNSTFGPITAITDDTITVADGLTNEGPGTVTSVTSAAGGTIWRHTRVNTKTLSASSITSITPLGDDLALLVVTGGNFLTSLSRNDRVVTTGTPDVTLSSPGSTDLTFTNNASPTPDTILRSAGSWLTDGFRVGHYFTVAGSASNNGTFGPITAVTASTISVANGLTNEGPSPVTSVTVASPNNGAWFVQGPPLSDTMVVLRAPDGGLGLGAVTSAGSISARHGTHRFDVSSDETAFTLDDLNTATPVAGPGGSQFASATAAEYFYKISMNGTRVLWELQGIGGVFINTATTITFSAQDAYIMATRAGNPGGGTDVTPGARLGVRNTGAGTLVVQYGTQPGNQYSAAYGCAVFNLDYSNTGGGSTDLRLYGSYHDTRQFQQNLSKAVGSIGRDNIALRDDAEWESVVIYGSDSFGLVAVGEPLRMANLLVSHSTQVASFFGPATATGLLLSDTVAGFSNFSPTNFVLINDPRTDLDLEDTSLFKVGGFQKFYNFNPRFVYTGEGETIPSVVQVLVTIEEIREDTGGTTTVFQGYSDPVTGLLNGGLGVDLKRQTRGLTNYAHRITTSGGGHPTRTHTIQLFSAVQQRDYPVDVDFPTGMWIQRYIP